MHDINRTMREYKTDYEFGVEFEYINIEGVLNEAGELTLVALVAELLDIADEAELGQFLGELFQKIGSKVGQFIKSPTGHTLKSTAQKVLPMRGTVIGSPAGGAVANQLIETGNEIYGKGLED
jgi:hypothetical protein